MIVSKGRRVLELEGGASAGEEAIAALLGPTGNLRAPTLRVGETLLVGFNEEAYEKVFRG